MLVKFWGTRGSVPTPGPDTIRYGGNTACIEVRSESGDFIILDSGTGIRELGKDIVSKGENVSTTIFISHTHWDHFNGFPFFIPAYIPGNEFNIFGPTHFQYSFEDVMTKQMDYSFFPVRTAELLSKVTYNTLNQGEMKIKDFTIVAKNMNHPVLCLGYRIICDDKVLVYTGDHEPYYDFLGDSELIVEEENNRVVEFCKDADLLISDAQYTPEEYEKKRGWGHTSTEEAIKLAKKANAKKLAFFHHDPERKDEDLDEILKKCKDEHETENLTIIAAKEKETIQLK